MDKYNDELDLTTKNSLSCIIRMIEPNSKILEFGPAYGRLTKHLHNVMGCSVDIVEINEVAGKEAAKYAEKAWIGALEGNLENFKWAEAEELYDYVIFADVLEHLFSPEKVLEKAKKVLKSNGNVLISIPNICHNSILANLYNDEFNYTKIGLLDSTHIRFWGLKNLEDMCHNLRFCINDIDAIHIPMMNTEQAKFFTNIDQDFQDFLNVREFGNVYQFILNLSKEDDTKINKVLKPKIDCTLSIYINAGEGYSEELKLSKEITLGENSKVSFDLKEFENIVSIRIDPVEGIKTKIEHFSILSNKGLEKAVPLNEFFSHYNEVWFDNIDPKLELNVQNTELEWLEIEIMILPLNPTEIFKKKDEISCGLNRSLEELQVQFTGLQLELTKTNQHLIESQGKLAELNEQLCDSNFQLVEMRDNYLEIQEKLEQKQVQLVQTCEKLETTLEQLTQTQNHLNNILNSFSWWVTKPLRMIKKVFRRIFNYE